MKRRPDTDDFGSEIGGVVGKGTIRVGDDGDELRVTLLVSGEQLVVRSTNTEVGSWDLDDVTIKRARKEFEIEVGHETVAFVPDDPDRFATHSLVGKRSRFRRMRRPRRRASESEGSTGARTEQADDDLPYLPGDPYLPQEFADLYRSRAGQPPVPAAPDEQPSDQELEKSDQSGPEPQIPELPAWAEAVVRSDARSTGASVAAADAGNATASEEVERGLQVASWNADIPTPIEPASLVEDTPSGTGVDAREWWERATGPITEPGSLSSLAVQPPTPSGTSRDMAGEMPDPFGTRQRDTWTERAGEPSRVVRAGEQPDSSAQDPPREPQRVLRGPWDPPRSVVTLVTVSDRCTAELSKRTAKTRVWAGWKIRLGCYYLMDQMSRIDAFPFNRLPEVTPEMRLEPGHVHNYEVHAATSGLTRHVCTSCGSVVVRSGGRFGGADRP